MRGIYQQTGSASSVPNNAAMVIEQSFLIHAHIPESFPGSCQPHLPLLNRVSSTAFSTCPMSLAVTKSTMRKAVKAYSLCPSYKIEELKMASQFLKDKASF